MSIRTAKRDEIEALGHLISSSFAQYKGAIPQALLNPYITGSSDIGARWDEATVLVFEDDGRIVGTVTYYHQHAYRRDGFFSELGWV